MPCRFCSTAAYRAIRARRRSVLGARRHATTTCVMSPKNRLTVANSASSKERMAVFANLAHVVPPTPRLHLAFLAWLREHGFEDVDCHWKWLEMALLVGVKPTEPR